MLGQYKLILDTFCEVYDLLKHWADAEFWNFANHEVTALTRAELDLTDTFAVNNHFVKNYYDAVIHCASQGRNNARSFDRDILSSNVIAWANLATNRSHYGKLINLASGAEFDLDKDIDCVDEYELWNRWPGHTYGLSKNIISRLAHNLPNFYNLRIFGCFDSSEGSRRPLKRCLAQLTNEQLFEITGDKLFDMFSLTDLATVIQAVLDGKITDQDLNCVYPEKLKLSEIIKMFADAHGLDSSLITVTSVDKHSYTGSGQRLGMYNLPLEGLELGLKNYC